MARTGRLRASPTAVVEAFNVFRRAGLPLSEFLGILEAAFDIDELEILRDAAEALDRKKVATAFDAYHLASALRRGEPLHTADEALLKSKYPTVRF